MQDNYVGDIGDYGKYGLLRHVTAAGLRLAVNWYRVVPTRPGKQEDGKYISYLLQPEKYRHYDPELFDCLAGIVHGGERSIEEIEGSGVLPARFFSDTLIPADRSAWHQAALLGTVGAEVVFLDPDNGLESAKMHQTGSAQEKHTTWQEVKDYYDRGQSVILYQHRPQMTKKEACIQGVMDFQDSFLLLETVYRSVAKNWAGLCIPIEICCLSGDHRS